MSRYLIAALYLFTPIAHAHARRAALQGSGRAHGVTGSLLLAPEGVNGTLAGPEAGLRAFLALLKQDPALTGLSWKESWSDAAPFRKLKVREKREIVSMGAPGVVTPDSVGAYVAPEDWNALISRPDVAVIDVRNAYETAIGRFAGALDPGTESFRAFPDWSRRAPELADKPVVAAYCTGGVRCEKATAFLRAEGFQDVFHLEGGVLKYLEQIPAAQSLWLGSCFVFDERVSVGHGLSPGAHTLCRGCRGPVSPEERSHPAYREGVCCPKCVDRLDPVRAARSAERQRQITLAAARGARHMGGGPG